MDNLWREAYLVGTEWDQYDSVFQTEWDFSNLEEAFDEGGVLHGKKVYVFGVTEPQLVHIGEKHKVMHIPAVVAVTSPFPPSEKIGIKSVQMETEMIVPMREMKMDWVPFIPEDKEWTTLERLKRPQIYVLKCVQRRAALKQLKQERVKKYEYCLPYIYQPQKELEPDENESVVPLMYDFEGDVPTEQAPAADKGASKKTKSKAPAEATEPPPQPPPPPLVCEYDWRMDTVEDFVNDLIEGESLPQEHVERFKRYLKDTVNAAKIKLKQTREERKNAIESMPADMKAALEAMRFYKFYPRPSEGAPDVQHYRSPYINRYYGKAHEVL